MRVVCLVLILWPGMAAAEEWRVLTGAEVELALTARVLQYEAGETQNFFRDGRTLYQAGAGESWGRWRVEGDQYCSVWPPSETWACYAVEARELEVKFIGDGGDVTVGRYVDLN